MAQFTRLMALALVFALVYGVVSPTITDRTRQSVLDTGIRAGCDYFQPGVILMSAQGPFMGGRREAAFNWAYRNLPWLMGYFVPFACVLALDAACTARLRPRDSVARCGRCGYALSGLKEPRCPECGRAI